MRIRRRIVCSLTILIGLLAGARDASAQAQASESPWAIDFGFGMALSVNGNVNSGAIGRLNGITTAVLPQPYGDVYGTGLDFRVGVGYTMNEVSELRGVLTFQSADADLVRLGDIGASPLYAQYSDYQSVALDLGYRRYLPLASRTFRVYGEGTLGLGFIDAIDAQLAAPQANLVMDSTDFYDQTAAFTWGINVGMLFRMTEQLDLNAQLGLRRISGLSEVDQLAGTGLEDINNDSARLTFPIVVGIRFRFK
jgi:hypothetical protein